MFLGYDQCDFAEIFISVINETDLYDRLLICIADLNEQVEANNVSSQPKKLPVPAPVASAKNGSAVATKKKQESRDSSDSDSSSEEEDVSI